MKWVYVRGYISFSYLVFQFFKVMIADPADPADFAKPFKHLDLN